MWLLLDRWFELLSPVGLFMNTEVLDTQSLEGSVEWINKVILARLSPDIFEAIVEEFLAYNAEFGSALLGEFGVDNTVHGSFDAVRRLRVDVDLDSLQMFVAVESVGVRRALGSVCPRFRWDYGTP
jgi:hypothetical protein